MKLQKKGKKLREAKEEGIEVLEEKGGGNGGSEEYSGAGKWDKRVEREGWKGSLWRSVGSMLIITGSLETRGGVEAVPYR